MLDNSPLNPNTTGQRPVSSSASSSSKGSSGLSSAAGAGIGIAIGALILGGALVVALCIRTKRRRRLNGLAGGQRLNDDRGDPPPTYELDTKSVRRVARGGGDATRPQVFEIHHPPKPPSPLEIDGKEASRISVTIQGTPPRHLGFQAHY